MTLSASALSSWLMTQPSKAPPPPDKVGVISRTLLYIEISTASGSERGPINVPLMGPRSLPLAVLIVLGRPLERHFTAKAAEINGFLFEDRFI